jgi:hypothetical protein
MLPIVLLLIGGAFSPLRADQEWWRQDPGRAPSGESFVPRLDLSAAALEEATRSVVPAQQDEEGRRWKALQARVAGASNEFMTITFRDGTELSGVVPAIFDDHVVVRLSSGERKLDRQSIRRVIARTPGNRKKTAAIGALAGMALAASVFYSRSSLIASDGEKAVLSLGFGFLLGGLPGGAIGMLVGRGPKSVVVYEAP